MTGGGADVAQRWIESTRARATQLKTGTLDVHPRTYTSRTRGIPRPSHLERSKRPIMEKSDPRDPKHWIPRDVFAAYLGPHSDDMLSYYDKALGKKNPLLMSFSPLALFLLPAWLGLRQQWGMWATFTGLIGVLPLLEHAFGISIPNGAFVGTAVAMGMMARGFLLTSATGQYRKLTRQGLSGAALIEALRDRARRSIPLAIAGGIGSVVIIFGLAYFASMLGGHPFP